MHTGEDDLLHRVVLGVIEPAAYWHVYSDKYPPTAANPYSEARLAWRDGAHSMFYAGDTPAAALWEVALRSAVVRRGRVYTDAGNLAGMKLARVTLTREVPVIDLRPPYRREVVDANCDLDSFWDGVLKQSDHGPTHEVSARLMKQLVDAGYHAGAALRWHSRQGGSDSVLLFFEPPMSSTWWVCDATFRLDMPDGQEQIREALAAQKLIWVGAPIGKEFEPGPDDALDG